MQKWSVSKVFSQYVVPFLPALAAGVFLFAVPPAGIAIILAYFAAPLMRLFHDGFKIPRTLSTLLSMGVMIGAIAGLSFMVTQSLMDTLAAAERHLEPLTGSQDWSGVAISFLRDHVLTAGYALVEHAVSFSALLFQQVFTLFIFLVAFFFALRETGKDRFWFLVYFPKTMRCQAHRLFKKAGELAGQFFSIEVRLFCLTFLLLVIGFFALSFSSPVGTAFFIALSDSLPFLGIGLFLFPMILFYFYTGDLLYGSALLLLYCLALLSRQFGESYLWASAFRVQPVHAFLITASSFYLFGLPGILLTPFLMHIAMKVKGHPGFTGR
ncbi:hypothetical protein NCCP2716_20810 [Sporosarcina sp. NCCP-2716]|uniref:AI-2E family transporter n=1 Tax=Sporosarcina sp. NCCP-2716 TaxID=2943679 RepID=UPI00203C06B3|nr:AI-2E family transporter [Sporosarcina sp. NCCP-2716]GKV69583.1 hypothetical protein NCCP2716_20810 [Sporosarcina sp. NCCP-2716]